jgi:SAM-dependent methyltransferase
VAKPAYAIRDLGAERVVEVAGAEYRTYYSECVVRKLIDHKGPWRTRLYFTFTESLGRHFLERLFRYLDRRGARALSVLEVCSIGHITEYLDEQPAVAEVHTLDVDGPFVEITGTKVAELRLSKVRQVLQLSDEETTRLPAASGTLDPVLAIGVIEHLPFRGRHRYVDEHYRVLAPGGHIAILDTPNRTFPLETRSVRLPGVQWLPAARAHGYAQLRRPGRVRGTPFTIFDAGAWRNASWVECLPSGGGHGLRNVREEAGYSWHFFRDAARSRTRRGLLPAFAAGTAALRLASGSPSLALPNLIFRKAPDGQ